MGRPRARASRGKSKAVAAPARRSNRDRKRRRTETQDPDYVPIIGVDVGCKFDTAGAERLYHSWTAELGMRKHKWQRRLENFRTRVFQESKRARRSRQLAAARQRESSDSEDFVFY